MVYAVLVSIVYFVELTVVIPHLLRGECDKVAAFILVPDGSFMYALDVLGYGFMSLATLFAAPVTTGDKLDRRIRWALMANGLLAPVIPLRMVFPVLIFVAALWIVTFPLSTVMLAVLFRRIHSGLHRMGSVSSNSRA